jgi:type II secretory pathway pseudopilin PulG
MIRHTRFAFTLFQLLLVIAILAVLFALFLPAVARLREAAARSQSINNLKQIGLSAHNYYSANNMFPPGVDDNSFSTAAYLLPYLEQGNVFQNIDFMKSVDDKANADVRKTIVKTFLDPRDGIKSVSTDFGPTNYLFCAGSKPELADNNGVFYKNSKVTFADIQDGTSNTMMAGATLKGDSAVKATDMRRQHVLLKKEDLKGIKDDAGVKDWEQDKNIVADRCASWMDGRFLQSTFTGTRMLNDGKPDVNCAGIGGLSGLRSVDGTTAIAIADGSVRTVNDKVALKVWKLLADKADGNPLPDF